MSWNDRRMGQRSCSSVDKELKWGKKYNDDSSITAPPEFEENTAPKSQAYE